MSTGAELSVVALPVSIVATTLAVGAAAVAGVAIVGGIAVVGTGRLMIAAGSYARDRLQERAELCASEHERFLRLRARPETRQIPKPQLAESHWRKHIAEEALVPKIMAPLTERLAGLQERDDARLREAERQAELAAAMQIHGPRLEPELAEQASVALRGGDEAALVSALVAIRTAVARADLDAIGQAQAALATHRLEVGELLAQTVDGGLRTTLSDWHMRIGPMLASRDLAAIKGLLRRGEQLLTEARERHAASLQELRAAELSATWGLLQAVGGLLDDLIIAVAASTPLAELRRDYDTLSARYEQLVAGPLSNRARLRAAAAELLRGLEQLRDRGLRLLDEHYREQITSHIRECLAQMCVDPREPFRQLKEEVLSDGTTLLVASDNGRSLELRVRPDGRVAYDADGFGDETCLTAVYSLRARLKVQGVVVELADPQLKPQVAVALEALEAITKLGIYAAESITIQRSGTALVIEAGEGAGFQRQLASVDMRGRVRYTKTLPEVDQTRAKEVVRQRVKKVRDQAENRRREIERREQRQREG